MKLNAELVGETLLLVAHVIDPDMATLLGVDVETYANWRRGLSVPSSRWTSQLMWIARIAGNMHLVEEWDRFIRMGKIDVKDIVLKEGRVGRLDSTLVVETLSRAEKLIARDGICWLLGVSRPTYIDWATGRREPFLKAREAFVALAAMIGDEDLLIAWWGKDEWNYKETITVTRTLLVRRAKERAQPRGCEWEARIRDLNRRYGSGDGRPPKPR